MNIVLEMEKESRMLGNKSNEAFSDALGRQLEESESMIAALTADYLNVYVIEPETDHGSILKLDGYVINGIKETPKNFTYSKVLQTYAKDRVCDEDREEFLKTLLPDALVKSFADGRERLELKYRVPIDGKLEHYSGMYSRISKPGEALKIIAGFRSTEDVISIQSKTRKEGLYSAYAAISDLYLAMFRVNIKDNTYSSIKTTEAVKRYTLPNNRRYDENLKAIMTELADEESLDSALAFLDANTVEERMQGKNHISTRFNGKVAGACKLHLMKEKEDKAADGELIHVILAVETLEEYIREEREHAEVVNSLSTIYSTIFRADIITHEYEILNSVPLMGKVAASKGNFDDVKETIIESFMEPEFREPLREFLNLDTLADRFEKVNTVTTDYKAPTGQWMQARFIVKRRDENGRAVETLYVARDITEEKTKDLKQQEALTHALAAAQQANRAKTTFLNSMSHDIRTPMNAIIGFTALAQTHLEDHAQVEDYLGKISTSSNHLLSLINDILDMSRIESGTVKLDENAVHIPDLLHDLRTMIQSLVNSKNLNLFIDTQDVVHEDVLTDKLRLNQVLLNIVGNAIKFTQPGGDIIIRLIEKPCSLKHYTTYEFSVKDNGIGMSKEFVGHIFDTFSREYSSTVSGIQGTGLGMAITKNIVDMMGGDIQVESEEGKGSLFTVTLNLHLANEPVKNEPIPELLGARVLVVDDDMNTCRSVSKMLRDIRMRPDWTTSAKEAIVHAQDAAEAKDEYKVYIIDYLMPDMNGIETVRRIRKVISEDISIIVLTAYDWSDIEDEAREAGVTAFVSKPIFMSELREALTQPAVSEESAKEEKQKDYDYSDKHVLLVEDNELNREIATAILGETGMAIDCAEDGDVAVAIINQEPADKYDLILMDVQMPRMDGYTATREIRTLPDNRKANIPIVAMTANAFEEDRKKAFESGMNGHIIKPISIEAIAKVLDEIFKK